MANTLPYGINITASDMRNIIEQNDKQQTGIRSWRQLFGNASLGYEAQADALKTDYNKAIADAYAANFQQQNNLMGQGLNVGATQELIGMNRQDLLSAYSNYMRDYQNAQSEVAQTYQDEVGMIDTALNERAENFANLYNSAYQYLAKELVGSTHLVTDPDTPLYYENKEEGTTTTEGGKGKEYAGQAKKPEDIAIGQGLGWLVDPDSGQALPWEQLSTLLFDDSGALTQRGIQYFDQLMNMRPEGYTKADGTAVKSFDAWLAEENPELRTWFASADPFNYTFKGTNAGTAAAYAGRESTDEAYNEGEYLSNETAGTLSAPTFNIEGQHTWDEYTKEVQKSYETLTDELQKKFNAEQYREFYDTNKSAFDEFESLSNELVNGEYQSLSKAQQTAQRRVASIQSKIDGLTIGDTYEKSRLEKQLEEARADAKRLLAKMNDYVKSQKVKINAAYQKLVDSANTYASNKQSNKKGTSGF
jgi:hypothetical protein